MARLGGTIFLNRKSTAALVRATEELHQMLAQGVLVVVFPEGTTSDGSSVLPFHASLFQAAVSSDIPVTPAHITYTVSDGSLAEDVCFWRDMTLVPHLVNLLSKRTLQAYVSFSAPEKCFASRKEASERMFACVVGLAASSRAQIRSQETVSAEIPQITGSEHTEADASVS